MEIIDTKGINGGNLTIEDATNIEKIDITSDSTKVISLFSDVCKVLDDNGDYKLNSVQLNLPVQYALCDEIDVLARDICGTRLTLDDDGVAKFTIEALTNPINVTVTDGYYSDAKKDLADKNINISGDTEYVRIIDPYVKTILLSKVTHSTSDKITKTEANNNTISTIPSTDNWFKSNTNIKYADLSEFKFKSAYNLFLNSSIETVILPDSVTSLIGWGGSSGCFCSCNNLKEIYLNSAIKFTTGSYNGNFYNSKNIKKVHWDTWQHFYDSWYDRPADSPTYYGNVLLYIENKEVIDWIAPNELTCLRDALFAGCDKLKSVTLHDSVGLFYKSSYKIGNTFYNCTNLESINFPDSLCGEWSNTFYNCTSLTGEIDLSNTLITGMYGGTFYNCIGITSIKLPKNVNVSVSGTGGYNFLNCINLKTFYTNGMVGVSGNSNFLNTNIETVYVPSKEKLFKMWNHLGHSGDPGYAVHYTPAKSDSYYTYSFPWCNGTSTIIFEDVEEELTEIEIPSDVTFLSTALFYNYKKLNSITGFENTNMTYVPACFVRATNITEFTLSDKVTSIEYCAFYGCSQLLTITGDDNVTSIENYAFYNCKSLTTLNTSKLTIINPYVFQNCSNLDNIDLSNVTSIGAWAFHGCSNLTSIDISKVTSITNGWSNGGGFSSCTSLKTVKWNPELTTIAFNLFNNDTSLETIENLDLSKITSFGGYCFYNCSSLKFPSYTIDGSNTNITYGDRCFLGASFDRIVIQNITLDGKFATYNDVYIVKNTCTIPNVSYPYRDSIGSKHAVVILEEGLTDTSTSHNTLCENYMSDGTTILLDDPTSMLATKPIYINGITIKYVIMRANNMSNYVPWDNKCTYIFMTQNAYDSLIITYSPTTNSSYANFVAKFKIIGGDEWVEVMKEMNTTYSDRTWNRCTNVTDTGYTSSYDGKTYTWNNEWADYDIFGVDRPA